MNDKEKDAAFRAERRAQLRRGIRIQTDTFEAIRSYLRLASLRIRAALATDVSEYEGWRLRTLQEEIRRAMGEFESRTGTAILSGLDRSFEAGGDLVTKPLEAAGVRIEAVLPRLDTRILDALKSFQTDKIKDISTTAVNKINAEIGQAALGVQSPFQAAGKVAEILDAPEKRARTIVRTELGTVYSEAGQQRMEQAVAAGVDGLQKQWRRSGKLHPRLTHEIADGQIVKVDEPFMVGGVPIMKPRDPSLDPKDRINCGCSSLPFMKHWRVRTPGTKPYTAEEIAASPSVRQAEEVRTPPSPAPPRPKVSEAALDSEMKAYVLDEGRKTGREFLWAYDARTGVKLDQNSGGKANVGISATLETAIADPDRHIIVHHNHPRSNSFSTSDILELNRRPGLRGLWAHGHDGSSYYAEKGRLAGNESASQAISEKLNAMYRSFHSAGKEALAIQPELLDDISVSFFHYFMVMLERAGIITKYKATLSKERQAAADRADRMFKAMIDMVLEDFQ